MGKYKLGNVLFAAAVVLLQVGIAENSALPADALTTSTSVAQTLGEVIYFAGDFALIGWTPCNGDLVSVAQNPQLYSLLGTTFGSTTSSDGKVVTGFKLPTLPKPDGVLSPIICCDGVYPRPNEFTYNADLTGAISLMPDAGVALPSNMLPCNGQVLDSEDELNQGLFLTLGTSFGPAGGDGESFQLPTLPAPIPGLRYAISSSGAIAPNVPYGPHYLGEVRAFPAAAPLPKGWMDCHGATMAVRLNQAFFSIIGARFGGDGVSTFKLPNLPDQAGVRWMICVSGDYPPRY